jgi:demethylmenaquinone methyltransferase/2-methoxy-6-polyprenyl-1,4-benzoquinol methylase
MIAPRPGTVLDPLPPHPLLERYHSDEAARRRQVSAWFDEVAGDYDWISQASSFGSGLRYRRQALLRAGLREGMRVLDVGCGPGILAGQAQEISSSRGQVLGLDPSFGMLSEAAKRGIAWRVQAVAEALPIASRCFDLLSMGYALRHVADLRTTFGEYRRVLKPGGKLLLLEITVPRSPLLRALLKLYMGRIVPWMARLGRSGRASQTVMTYYWDTIESCVPPAVILDALRAAGFTQVERVVQLGIFSEYTAVA